MALDWKDSYRIGEVKSSPGLRGFDGATGMKIARHVFSYCQELVASDGQSSLARNCYIAGLR